MKVYIITQAYEGDIRGVYAREADADAEAARIRAVDRLPIAVEEHDVVGDLHQEPTEQGTAT